METMRGLGSAVGEYVGDGQGEAEAEGGETSTSDDIQELEVDGLVSEIEDNDDAKPLLVFYDCETTGFSIYKDHITEVAAKIVAMPTAHITNPTFSSLVRTSRNIPPAGR